MMLLNLVTEIYKNMKIKYEKGGILCVNKGYFEVSQGVCKAKVSIINKKGDKGKDDEVNKR